VQHPHPLPLEEDLSLLGALLVQELLAARGRLSVARFGLVELVDDVSALLVQDAHGN
jgi:hypothetical protein